jgi:hypothetical protein
VNDVLAFTAYLLLPLIGIGIWRLDAVRRLDLGGRIAVAGAAGTAIVAAVLAMLSIVSISWSRSVVISIIIVITAVSIYLARPLMRREKHPINRLAMAALIIIAILLTYGLLDARLSCGDLHFFWGPKAVHFYRDGGITLGFLADPNTVRMNPGYPLLLPLIYVWSETIARQFSWFSAVLSTALFLFGSVALVRSTSRDDRAAVLMAVTLAYAFAIANAAGAGEPLLIFFETLAIVAVTFIRDRRAQIMLAALGLAGAVMTKIEGATFAIAVVIALVVVRRTFKRAMLIAAPAAILLGAWLAFVRLHNLSEFYRGAGMPVYFAAVPKTLITLARAATYDLYGLPWIVPIVLIAVAPHRRNAALPLLIAALTLGAAFFFYIHFPDPTGWILSSAPRVLLTPLAALVIASAAAWRSAGDLS